MIKEAERKAYTWHDGHMKDRVEYRLLQDEWVFCREMQSSDFWVALGKNQSVCLLRSVATSGVCL